MKQEKQWKKAAGGFGILITAVLFMAGCALPSGGPADGTTGVSFTLGGNQARSTAAEIMRTEGTIAALVVSIEKNDGTSVYDLKRLALVNMNGSFISERLPLSVGSYRLTAFFVVDEANNVLFATPLEGSPLADQVRDPLPIDFGVQQGIVTAVVPQVVSTEAEAPEKFGYTSFRFEITGGSYPALSVGRFFMTGPDGECFTADDELAGYYRKDYKSYGETNTSKSFAAGSDGTFFTDDDEPFYWWWGRYTYGGSSQDGPGPDGIWFTEDDHAPEWNVWDNPGLPGVEKLFTDPGPDRLMFTSDDVMSGYYMTTEDADGNPVLRVHYSGPGADGVWFTSDDEAGPCWFGVYFTRDYSGTGNFYDSWDREIRYSGPGPDGIWFTSDDEIGGVITHEFGEGNKYFTRETFFGPGEDGVFLTADDVSVMYYLVENQY